MVVIIDYGLGNKGSIQNMLKKLGVESVITSDVSIILKATKLILPGVGAFDDGMNNLSNLHLIPVLQKKVILQGTPILGICLGMQLLCNKSEEGILPGLGFIDATVSKFPKFVGALKLRTPHLGWNTVSNNKQCLLLNTITNPRFYFVHSYYCQSHNQEHVTESTNFGLDFNSIISHKNIFGVQFHPEKSHANGKKLLQNFIELPYICPTE